MIYIVRKLCGKVKMCPMTKLMSELKGFDFPIPQNVAAKILRNDKKYFVSNAKDNTYFIIVLNHISFNSKNDWKRNGEFRRIKI